VKLNEDMISYSGDIVKITSKPKNYQEGPWLYKRNGLYYLAYSSTCWPEGIGYCTSTSTTGPWLYGGLIMEGQKESAGNHPGIIDYKGRLYIFGFNAALPGRGNQRRSVCADELIYNADGSISTFEWSAAGPSQICSFNPYVRTEAETIAVSAGVRTEKDSITGVYVTKNNNDDYIKVGGVDFGKGAVSFEASVASAAQGGKIEIRVDSISGNMLGTCDVSNTSGWQNWSIISCTVNNVKGIHDIYFMFIGGEGDLFNFDWWRFNIR
jgi:arabinoxylan arabinofuranohydrolase